MRVAGLASLLAVLALAVLGGSSAAAVLGPKDLHGFLLRADEPASTTFHRTPSFAWDPVPGALRYEFQLSTSSVFRDNGILYDNSTLVTPVEAPPLTLPWITGSPHALYARVRALFASGASPWSAPFGFDVTPPAPPTPLSSYPGVLRWTPIEGADGYEVWLVDANKTEFVRTNVLDEREFYTFHQAPQWTGTVRWRVRALRGDVYTYRVNGMPVAMHGAWSPVYSSTNPPLTAGPISLVGTVSDVFSNGSSSSPAHELMPAFMWTGNQTASGTTAELFRVYVFTDGQCLNRVFTSAVVGSPAYAPRMNGPLSLPGDNGGLTAARGGYLGDGVEQSDVTYDGERVAPNEQLSAAKPTVQVPGSVPAAVGTTPPPDSTGTANGGTSGSSGSSTSSSSSSGAGAVAVGGNLGPPVDLWDVSWPQSGYYWTVVPVEAVGAGSAGTTVASPGAFTGSTAVPVLSTTGLLVGDTVMIGMGTNVDSGTIVSVGSGSLTLDKALGHDHFPGEVVRRVGGSITYQDLELPQDACAAGRVQRFGISSEPSLTTAQEPFATGLSASGRLVSAAGTPAFYGQPLVAWTPAFNANAYEVQWSRERYPFAPEVDPRTGVKGYLTFSTSAVLPLGPGTWWYRVRGFDYNLPTGVQQMSWSTPERLAVTAPKFRVTKPAVRKNRFKIVGGSK